MGNALISRDYQAVICPDEGIDGHRLKLKRAQNIN